MNTIGFLKNYIEFACYARSITSKILLENLKQTIELNVKKVLMLRIVEELIASTEDLAMWLVTISQRNDGDKRYRDIWERFLCVDVDESKTKEVLIEFKKLGSSASLLDKLDLPSIPILLKKTGATKEKVEEAIEKIKESIDTALYHRLEGRGRFIRFHNKIKHGMAVYLDEYNKNNIMIRDLKLKPIGRRRNRNFQLSVDILKAERIVGTITATAQSVEALITLLLWDIEYRIKTGKIRMWSKTRQSWLKELG